MRVSLAKMAHIATNRILGRDSAGNGDVESLTLPQVRTLLNVEDGADVTDTTNVTAAGALMDSEVTDLAGIKSLDTSTLQVKPTEGAFVDGDKTKLDGIETGATADQTAAEIKTAYESNLDTNAFTDAEQTKLAGIETGADVTDETNVVSALSGATLTDAGTPQATDKVLVQDSSDSDNLKYVDFSDFSSGTTVDVVSNVAADRILGRVTAGSGDSEELTAAQARALLNVEDGADVTDTANVTSAGALMDSEVTNLAQVKAFDSTDYATAAQGVKADSAQQPPIEGAFVDGDKTKLDGIEASADVTDTANVTAAGALMDSELTSIADVKALNQSVISGASPTFSNANFTEATDKNYVTDAQAVVIGNTSGTNTGDEAAASLTVSGVVELATTAEIDTGTDSSRAMPIDQFVASKRNIEWIVFDVVAPTTDCATGTNLAGDFVSPIAGTILQNDSSPFYLYATNSTAGTTGTMVVDININGTSIMTTNKLDFDTTEKTTTTAATPPDLTTTSIAVGDIVTIDIDSTHTTAAKGLKVYMAIRQ